MKHSKIFRILAIAITLSLLVVALPAAPALAYDYDIDLDPDDGEIGDSFDVKGDDFPPSEDVGLFPESRRLSPRPHQQGNTNVTGLAPLVCPICTIHERQ